MADSEKRSSPLSSPRSEILDEATSAMIRGVVVRLRAHGAGEGGVAHGAVAHQLGAHLLAGAGLDPLAHRQEEPVALDHGPGVGEVDRGQRHPLALDVAPDVELGPVRQREAAQVLARVTLPW